MCVCVCVLKAYLSSESSQNLCKFWSVEFWSTRGLSVCSCVYSACVHVCVHMAFVWFCMSEGSLAQLDTSAVDSHTHITNK